MRYSWTPTCSTLAQKYQRYGYVHTRPFLPGERYRRGYKELQSELKEVRQTLAKQEYTRQSLPKTVVASFYKSPVGCRTSKGTGGIFWSEPAPRVTFFSDKKF